MSDANHYAVGQRWTFKTNVAEFEETLVIGKIIEAHPEFGWNERQYEVYVRYSELAKPFIPSDYDGTVLSLTDAGMNRSVRDLVGQNEELPWWWVYGRRFNSKENACNQLSSTSCERVFSPLPRIYEFAKQRAKESLARRKDLQAHREKSSSKRAKRKPSKTVADSWKRIEAWYAEYAYATAKSLAVGASAAAVKRFEKAIGLRLPDDFRESVTIHDGGGWWVPWRFGELQSLDQILEQWKMYSEWQATGKYATDEGGDWKTNDIKGSIKPVFWNKKRIYVTNNSGDHLTLDLDPPSDGTYGQVIDHSHEVGPTVVVATGWGEFLRNLVEDLESGKYVYLEEAGSIELVEDVERELG